MTLLIWSNSKYSACLVLYSFGHFFCLSGVSFHFSKNLLLQKLCQEAAMWAVLFNVLRPYVYYISVPVGIVVGGIGVFTVEKYRKETPFKEKTIQEERDERKLKELEEHDATDVAKLKSKIDIPKTVLDRNDKSRLEHLEKKLWCQEY